MRSPPSKQRLQPGAKSRVIGTRAFAAISAVEGLKLNKASRERLKALEDDETLTPAQRRAAVLKTYQHLSRKK